MPFQYSTPVNPFVGDIATMMQRRGIIAGNEAQGIAQAWGGAAQGLGQAAAGVATALTDPKVTAQRQALEVQTRDLVAQKTIEAGLMLPQNQREDGGGVDDTKMSAWLQRNGDGHAALAWRTIAAANAKNKLDLQKTGQEIAASQLTTEEKTQALFEKRQAFVSELAYHTKQAIAANPEGARSTFLTGLAQAAAGGGLDPKTAQAMAERTRTVPPEQLGGLLDSYITPGDRARLEGQAAETKLKGSQSTKAEADAAEATAKAAAYARWGVTGTPPSVSAQKYRVQMPGGGVKDVPLEFVAGKGEGDQGHYFLSTPTGKVEMFPGKDFVDVPAASVIVNQQGEDALKNMPGWALDASRPSGPDANKLDPKLGKTPNGVFQDAQAFISFGTYPPTARGNDPMSKMQRSAVDSKVAAIAADAGMDIGQLRAIYRANAGALKQQQAAYDVASVAISKADKDVDLLEKILPKVGDTGSPLLNQPLRTFETKVVGNPDLAEFATRLRSVQSEYTRVINASPTGAGGGVISDHASQEVDKLLAPDATVAQIVRSIQALKSEGQNRLLSQGEQIQKIAARMKVGGSGDTNRGAGGGGPAVVYAQDPQGGWHKGAPGTALPAGWKLGTPPAGTP
jgi:hypothetical protein